MKQKNNLGKKKIERADINFYRIKEGGTQEEFYSRMLSVVPFEYNLICFNRGEPQTEKDSTQKIYHLSDCTIFVNKDESFYAATITGREAMRNQAKSKIEEITKIKLEEFDVLALE